MSKTWLARVLAETLQRKNSDVEERDITKRSISCGSNTFVYLGEKAEKEQESRRNKFELRKQKLELRKEEKENNQN